MGLFDNLLDIANIVVNELAKDRVKHIIDWLNESKESGAAFAILRRKDGKGIAYITGEALDFNDSTLDTASWNIECNTGFKKIMEGDQSGLYEIFGGEKEVVYKLNKKEKFNNLISNSDTEYLISKDYKESGPFNASQLMMMMKNGLISHDFHACQVGSSNWVPIFNILGIIEDGNEDNNDEDGGDEEDDEEEDDDFDDDEDDDD